eukprot:TRINITY_DN432_c0_g1_i1.p1 TRINITY_DN432_c0_g1~~TRINITY_DN432_c0_g1_i1.p1  ORF type:complete len:411 (-),score=111.94 TRINITY_DN432_c0_g1_i1:100-1332(-)
MISIVSNGQDFSPFSLRSSLTRQRSTLANTPKLRKQPSFSTFSPTTRASIELLPTSSASSLELVSKVRDGLQYYAPELCEDGVNGTYFLKDKNGKNIAVFKPQDEEGACENNPKRSSNDNNLSNKGILPGEAASREVAAFLLDREHFYGVPRTLMVKISHSFSQTYSDKLITKIGSLQEFIENDGSSEDFGPRSFPISEVHKIGILDVQILNVDRHAGNVLVRKQRNNTVTLTPIDQGFSLPDTPELLWFEWMNWPQAKVRFDDDAKDYIRRIDPQRDARVLKRELGIRNECLKYMQITVALLKKAVELDLTLYDIGLVICRKNVDQPSIFEELCQQAEFEAEEKVERHIKKADLSNSNDESEETELPEVLREIYFNEIILGKLDRQIRSIAAAQSVTCTVVSASFVKSV